MKKALRIFVYFLLPFILGLFSCEEDEMPNVTGMNYTYQLQSISEYDITGHMKIRERADGSTQVELVLNNTDPNGTYPAYIHFNNVLEGGGVAITLTPVPGHSGNSVSEIQTLDSGLPITFEELRMLDGHLNIQFDNNSGILVAQSDIGLNALTGRYQQFNLQEKDVPEVSGILTIEERQSGFSLMTIQLESSTPGKYHPVTLNFGSMIAESRLAGTLNPVDGNNGISKTHLEQLDGALLAPYRALVDFKGFVRIHLGEGVEMNTILAQGNISFVEN